MTAQEWRRQMRVIQIALGLLSFALVATWAWSLNVHGRLTRCEVQTSAVVEDIREIKATQKDMRKTQIETLRFLQSRAEDK